MKIEFDTRYLEIVGGDIKTAMMLAVGITKQIEADKTDEPCEYGNYWGMTINKWEALGFGGKKSQKTIRKILLETKLWKEILWGYPKHTKYWVDIKKIEELIAKIIKTENTEAKRIEEERSIAHVENLNKLIGEV